MTATAPPAGRYGRAPDPRRRPLRIAALALLGLTGLAAAVWLGLGVASAPVTWSQVGFDLDGAQAVDITYDVSRPDPSVPVECRLEAQNTSHAQVGVVVVEVPAATEVTVRRTTTVRTSEQAVTGIVSECWPAD